MELQCRCTACSASFRVDAAAAGKKARCPKCSAIVDVPAAAKPAAPEKVIRPADGPSVAVPATPKAAPPPPKVSPPRESAPPASKLPPVVSPAPAKEPPPAAADAASTPVPEDDTERLTGETASASKENVFGDFSLSTSSARSAAPVAAGPQQAPKGVPARKKSVLPLVIGGSLALLVLVAGGIGLAFMLGSGSKGKGKADKLASTPGDKGILILDWPEEDRKHGALAIDGKRLNLPPKGEARFTLNPGSRKIFLQRRGYEPVETTLTLSSGQTSRFAPKWKTIDGVAGSGSSPPPGKASTDTKTGSFPIGGGVPSSPELSPQGFAGWYQLLESAERRAAREKKEILIVFGSSDGDGDTKKLAQDLGETKTKAAIDASFVPVVIDFPKSSRGYNVIEDRFQNATLARQYGIRQVPAVVLADENGQPYFIEREWKSAGNDLSAALEAWKQKRPERDQLLAAARTGDDAARLAGAEKALAWLQEKRLVALFPDDVRAWMTLAQKFDPANQAGKLEAFFEADLQVRLRDLRLDDEQDVQRIIASLDAWTGAKRFTNPDRGASLHLLAARLLIDLEKHDEGLKHLEEAATYEPKDKNLKDALAAAKGALKNRNVLSSGTGFVISDAGYLLTNHHVVEGNGKVVVRFPGIADPLPATVIAEDANRDIALIKIDVPSGAKLAPIPISTAEIGRGVSVTAFGYPLGDAVGSGLKLTTGVVAALPDPVKDNMLLLDVRVNPGNSGGPLCDNKGNVIGMVTAKTGVGFSESVDSYGMALPAQDLVKFLDLHLPKEAPRAPAGSDAPLPLDQVDKRVSPSVLMILKVKA